MRPPARLLAAAACLAALITTAAHAQPMPVAPGAAAPAASAPPRQGPKLMSPAETRDSATMPGEMRPEQPAKPQISIPLGRTPPPPAAAAASGPVNRARPGTKAGINDAVARCEAITDATQRARCREGLARQTPAH